MARRHPSLTQQQCERIRSEYSRVGGRALANELGVPLYHVKNLAYKEQLRKDPAHSLRRPVSPDEEAFIREHYPDRTTEWVAGQIGRTVISTYRLANKLCVKKSEAFLTSEAAGRIRPGSIIGRSSRFRKGQPSLNKGKPMRPEVREKVAHTWFRKGQVPHNMKFDGYISVRRDTGGREYFFIRTAPGKMKHLHRHIWEEVHGAVPAGHVVTFKDGNRANCQLENLECITMAERLARTTIWNYPPEMREAMRMIGRLKREIKVKANGK